MRLVALTPGARALGLRWGMTVGEARSLVPDVRLDLLDPVEEARDRGELLRTFERLSDRVQSIGEQDIVAEISRTAPALGGEAAVVTQAVELAQRLGHRVAVAITDDPLAAIALAGAMPQARTIVPPGQMAKGLAPLSVRVLRASADLEVSLRAIGIETLGGFAELDPASIAGRFGAEGSQLHRIARGACTLTTESVIAWVAESLPRVLAPLAGATTTLQLHFVLPGLLATLSEALAARDLAVVRLRCSLALERGNPVTFGVRVGRPTRDPRTLEQLVRVRLEGLTLNAPIEEWCIEVAEAVPEQGWQPGLTDRSEACEPLPDVLARLSDALGAESLFAAELHDTWKPEAAWKPVPFRMAPPLRRPAPLSDDPVAVQERWEQSLTWARPSQLLIKAVALEVRTDEVGTPVGLLLEEGWRSIDAVQGPECLSGAWWRPEAVWQRRYWVVEVRQRSAWIFESEQCWFLHGWF